MLSVLYAECLIWSVFYAECLICRESSMLSGLYAESFI
jgi:hypothetical protein